jgi:predicted Zn-ribbon and HTH transcriptional regulator
VGAILMERGGAGDRVSKVEIGARFRRKLEARPKSCSTCGVVFAKDQKFKPAKTIDTAPVSA